MTTGLARDAQSASPIANASRVWRAGRVYPVRTPVITALETLFRAPVHAVKVIEHSLYARAHYGMAATTRPNLILLAVSGDQFVSNPELLLHEYFHVLRQWNTGQLSRRRYLAETFQRGYRANRFEMEAREFATAACEQYLAILRSI